MVGNIKEQRVTDALSSLSEKWKGEKVTGEHTGTIGIKEGHIMLADGTPTSAIIVIDMKTIVVTDIEDPKSNARLTGHLNSSDFFNVEEHSTGTFEAKSFTPISGAKDREANYTLSGKLTLKGITHDISFPAYIAVENGKLNATGKLTFDRSKYDIRYGSGSFFDGLGDKMIYDDFELSINLSSL